MTAIAATDWSETTGGPGIVVLAGRDDPDREFRLGTRDYPWHRHARGQLICIESGMLHVRTESGAWLLPPHRAGWMPPGILHQVGVHGVATGWTVLIAPPLTTTLPEAPKVVGVSELMRALVHRAVDWSETRTPEQDRQAGVLLDEVRHARPEHLHLPMPQDPRLKRIALAILNRPETRKTLDMWATWGGISPRSLRRLIVEETGLSFAQWAQQARLIRSLELLAQGNPVSVVSDRLGYETPSSFIAMFKRSFGVSPGRFFAD
ncbi:helix-turn-helix transcriptional regulator [Methylobacterium terricola]|uniref:Helix-turn-helix transcriptional regulator n=1 Tax=Methylobacterium terricola TaxID=2583531 RepID=A0A5C4LPL9_9HYPH|nr:helix-turn-helix transcriptional regulator [Methylobacterium terricola]TNC16368.1 helix-turn-helix transcriptional regulator [Methylobacterium terricola]